MLLVLGALKRLFRRRPFPPGSVGGSRIMFRGRSRAGVPVDHDIALTYSAVWACVRIISETLACVPWNVMKHRADSGRERQPENRVDHLFTHQSNTETAAFDFKQTMIAHALTWGNGYAAIDRGPNGNVNWLWQLPPDRVAPGRLPDGELVYVVQPEKGERVVLPARSVLHFRGLGWDGVVGYSVIEMAAQSLGLGLATERFGSEFFGNGAHHCGVLVHPSQLGDEAYTRLKESLQEGGGIEGDAWNRPLILEEGMTWKSLGIPPDNAQFLETRRFQVDEVGRWFRVPIFKLQEMKDAAVRANVEHQSIEFVTDTLLPWASRFENEVNVKLLQGQTRKGVYLRINLDGLLRGDLKSRYEAYAVGRMWTWLSPNDVRRLEDMNPIPDDQGGNEYMLPGNMQSGGAIVQGEAGEDGKDGKDGEDGKPGERGDEGESGADGERGERGLPGEAGEPGLRGTAGVAGAPGDRGETGRQGERGDGGDRGPQGTRGEDGRPYGPALRKVLGGVLRHVCRTEAGVIEAAARRRKPDALERWLATYYEKHVNYVAGKLETCVVALVELAKGAKLTQREARTVHTVIDAYSEEYCHRSMADLQHGAEVPEVVERWRNGRVVDELDTLMQRIAVPLLFGVLTHAASDAE